MGERLRSSRCRIGSCTHTLFIAVSDTEIKNSNAEVIGTLRMTMMMYRNEPKYDDEEDEY